VNRRSFLRAIATGAGAVVAAPLLALVPAKREVCGVDYADPRHVPLHFAYPDIPYHWNGADTKMWLGLTRSTYPQVRTPHSSLTHQQLRDIARSLDTMPVWDGDWAHGGRL